MTALLEAGAKPDTADNVGHSVQFALVFCVMLTAGEHVCDVMSVGA